MPRPIRGLLFDKDGTLFDFDATWSAVVARIIDAVAPDPHAARRMAELGGYDPDTRRFLPGSPIVAGAVDETARLWAPLLGGPSPLEVAQQIAGLSEALTGPETLVPAVSDLPGLLAGLKTQGRELGVATHDGEAAARAQLAAVGALAAFDFVAGYDSGYGHKPSTGMLAAFCSRVAVTPQETAVIGDSLHDLQMARAGGALAIGVLTGPATEADLAPHADLILPSIAALPGWLSDRR
ncbi:MAG: HAD family hydrolase [Pikeienuella sp.]